MKSRLRNIIIALVAAALLMQFYQPKQNAAAESVGAQPQHIKAVVRVPENVRVTLARSCYDCHSNATDYPWYSYVQPVGWWLEGHITEGKDELNFSAFGSYSRRRQLSKLQAISGQLKAGTMPPESYAALHGKAVLSSADRQALLLWAEHLQDSLSGYNSN